jgi:hypothetical protein
MNLSYRKSLMHAARRFAAFAITMTLLGSFATARAGMVTVLTNLDQQPQPTGASPLIGQSFIAGASDQMLYGVRMQLDPATPPSSSIMLEVEARNIDGTLGQTLFSDFTSSYDQRSGVATFLANAPFSLQANTGYWLVLSDPTAGDVKWAFTTSQVYQSKLGYGLPSFNTSYYSDDGQGNARYYQPSDGPQMFELMTIIAVPEPSSLVQLSGTLAFAALAINFQRRRSLRRLRAQSGRDWPTMRSRVA